MQDSINSQIDDENVEGRDNPISLDDSVILPQPGGMAINAGDNEPLI